MPWHYKPLALPGVFPNYAQNYTNFFLRRALKKGAKQAQMI